MDTVNAVMDSLGFDGKDLLFDYGVVTIAVTSVFTFPSLFFITLPYGRHSKPGWGPMIDEFIGWTLMELPSPVTFVIAFCLRKSGSVSMLQLALLAFWVVWYTYRGPVYAMGARGKNRKLTVMQVLAGASFTAINGYCNGAEVVQSAHLDNQWVADARFVVGVLLMVIGAAVNIHSDRTLRGLRKPGETGYKIPHGGAFEFVSAPNYFGEMVLWLGWGVATWTFSGVLFFLFTVSNLFPRALSHHNWYVEKFRGEYPKQRKAVIPFVC
eukprot:TRINITY_DN40375_c0_g1_i1.p1 TRINITY_DN40375_c0_g1~~TRINITY_DN40375_c0_g1_i1.p1  ORF type:complete len:268 (+),score=53.33 TRINITY_DN40375_c0_g1_i1:98-901(+)